MSLNERTMKALNGPNDTEIVGLLTTDRPPSPTEQRWLDEAFVRFLSRPVGSVNSVSFPRWAINSILNLPFVRGFEVVS